MKTPMTVLWARDWTIFRDSRCRAAGKSWGAKSPSRSAEPPKTPTHWPWTHGDTGVDGTDEEDGGEEDEDADVDTEHQWGAEERGGCECRGVGGRGEGFFGGLWHSLGEHHDLEAADEAEDEEGAGHVASKAIVHLLGVLRGQGGQGWAEGDRGDHGDEMEGDRGDPKGWEGGARTGRTMKPSGWKGPHR